MQFDLEKSIGILEKTPQVLYTLCSNLSEDWTHQNEGENTWSVYDILGHLIHGEKTDWIPRMTIILSKSDNKTFEPFDRFAQFEDSKGKTFENLLDEFSQLRQKNLEILKSKNLSKEDLNQEGIHPELGKVILSELLSAWLVHDLSHLSQISRVMAKQYKTEVGAWLNYMPLLHK